MQVTLWLVLGGTVALAALVTRAARTELGQVRTIDTVTLTLPTKWRIADGNDGTTLVIAREPGAGNDGRTLTIRRLPVRGVTTAAELLTRSGLLRGAVTVDESDDAEQMFATGGAPRMQPVLIAGWPGVMTVVLRPQASPMGMMPTLRTHVLACTILPSSRQAIIVHLEAPYGQDRGVADAGLVKLIGERMSVRGESPLRQETTLGLSNGLRLNLPQGWAVMPQTDPNRTNRLIVLERHGEQPVIEITPCVFFPDDSPEEVSTMLQLHHPALARAELRVDSEGIWRITWPDAAQRQGLTGARLIARADGNSVLLIFAGAPVDGADFTRAYEALTSGISGSGASDFRAMAGAGTELASRFATSPLEETIGGERPEQWWSLRDTAADASIGWVHVKPSAVERWGDTRESRWRIDRHVVMVQEEWREEETGGSYRYDMKRSESDGGGADGERRFGITSTQSTLLYRGRLGTRVTTEGRAVESPGGEAPMGFVPGGWLSRALGRIEIKPMILRSESVPAGEVGRATAHPMRLIVTPTGPLKTTDGGKTPLRCVSIEVSGTGEISRYYFRPDGALSTIDFPDNLQQTRSDPVSVKLQSTGDARMAP